MKPPSFKRILDHPDREELISKLVIGISSKDIHEWLKYKYTNVSEIKFVIAEKVIESFKDNYLDIYDMIQKDLGKTKSAIIQNTEDGLSLAVKNNSAYKAAMIQSVNEELDVRKIVKGLCLAIETRLSQVFDEIQEDPRNINTRVDRLLIEYAEVLGNLLEKSYKFTEAPAANQVINNNITLQVVDQHITVFHDVIRDVLSQMDLESSLFFMEVFNDKMSKLKSPDKEIGVPSDIRLAEVKLLNETINKKINE